MSNVLIFTGGHHNSALEVATSLNKLGTKIIWIGHRHSMWNDISDSAEYREVTGANIEFIDLKAGKFYHTLNPIKLLRIPWGFVQAFLILLNVKKIYKKDLKGIVSFGGYLAVPIVFAGWLLNISSVTHEQTSVAGWANKFISLFVKKIGVSWSGSFSQYPVSKIVFTGLPLRKELLAVTKRPTNPKTIYITGGKQGSHFINSIVFKIIPALVKEFQIVHQVGNNSIFNDFQTARDIRNLLPEKLKDNYKVYDYLSQDQVARVFSQSSVVVGRSGAHITYELAYLGVPCVLIPLPNSSHNEQLKNANILAAQNQAVVISQSELTPETLINSIKSATNFNPKPLWVPIDGTGKFIQLINQELL